MTRSRDAVGRLDVLTLAEESCEIELWNGYVRSCFFAVLPGSSPVEERVVTSPLFWRLGGGEPKAKGRPLAAFDDLVAQLRAAGYEPVARGAGWHDAVLRRIAQGELHRAHSPIG